MLPRYGKKGKCEVKYRADRGRILAREYILYESRWPLVGKRWAREKHISEAQPANSEAFFALTRDLSIALLIHR